MSARLTASDARLRVMYSALGSRVGALRGLAAKTLLARES